MVFMGVFSVYALLTTSPAHAANKTKVVAVECENDIVVLNERLQGDQFQTSVIKFCSHESAEEFTNNVNAEPISKNRQARLKVYRHATLYTQ